MLMRCAILIAVLAAAPVAAIAAEADSQDLVELDEVVVSARSLSDRILALESSFYQLYNELNKDDEFDMFCTQIPMRRGSAEKTRACLPKFYADAYADSVNWLVRCQYTAACYTPPDPTFVLFARNEELQKHMASVVNSDPRLMEMNAIRTELAIRLSVAAVASEQSKRAAVNESGATRAQQLERQRCLRPTPPKANARSCSSELQHAPGAE